jgi:nitrate reductase gamma subunit
MNPSPLIFFLTSILPYVSLFIFINGIAYKIYKWARTQKASGHFSIYISRGQGNTGLNMLKDLVLFPRMFKKEKVLWIASWLFHLSIIVSAISHYKVFLPYNIVINGLNPQTFNLLSNIMDAGSSIVMISALIILFGRRLTSFMRRLSEPEDYLLLGLVTLIAVTGYLTRYSSTVNLLSLRRYFASLVQLNPNNIPTDPIFLIHYTSVMILMIYFPFGKMTHMIGSILTSRLVRRVK